MDYSKLVFIDTETTGLDPRYHEIWEVGSITWEASTGWVEQRCFLPLSKPLGEAEPIALEIGKFFERYEPDKVVEPMDFVQQFSHLTWNKHLVGAIPSFDEERIRALMYRYNWPFKWHYHLLDIEAMIVGYLKATSLDDLGNQVHTDDLGWDPEELLNLPWKHRDLVKALGVEWPKEGEHTALGDARLVRDCFVRMFGEPHTLEEEGRAAQFVPGVDG